MDVLIVATLALGTALATGLGALPLAVPGMDGERWIGRGDAIATGCMIGASIALIDAGVRAGAMATVLGAVLGGLVVYLAKLAPDPQLPTTNGTADSRATIALVAIMTLHSCAEGIGVGVAFGGGAHIGLVTAVAIAIHNIPEGLAISLVAVPRGASIAKAAWLSVLSSLPQPVLAVPAYLLVEQASSLLPWGFGLAAGAMIVMAIGWLVPDSLNHIRRREFAAYSGTALSVMLVFQLVASS